MDIVVLIRRDHDEIAQLFERVGDIARERCRGGAAAGRACAELVIAARVHTRAEERVLYEALRRHGGPLLAFALAAPHEHDELDITLDKLLLPGAVAELDRLHRVARDLFLLHARDEEEADILPLVATALSPVTRIALAHDLVAEKARIRPQIARLAAVPAHAA
jgi:hypothetical protein